METDSSRRVILLDEIDRKPSYRILPAQNTIQFFKISGRNDHHRRPRSLGGTKDKRNLFIDAPRAKHMLWHVLFGTLNPHQIVDELNTQKYFGKKRQTFVDIVREPDIVIREGQYGCRNGVHLRFIFEFMFREQRTIKEKLSSINHLWLDPDFKLVLV